MVPLLSPNNRQRQLVLERLRLDLVQLMKRWERQWWSKDPSKMRRLSGVGQVKGKEYAKTRRGKLKPSWSKWPYTRKDIFFLWDQKERQSWVGAKVVLEGGARITFVSSLRGQVNTQWWRKKYWNRRFEKRRESVNELLRGIENTTKETWSFHAEFSI